MKGSLVWKDGRWHCDGQGIHAGEHMELKMPTRDVVIDGRKLRWLPVRIESGNGGERLFAYMDLGGLTFVCTINVERDQLRWPS